MCLVKQKKEAPCQCQSELAQKSASGWQPWDARYLPAGSMVATYLFHVGTSVELGVLWDIASGADDAGQ